MLLEHTTLQTTLERELALIVASTMPGHGGGSEEPDADDAEDDDTEEETEEKS
jgi:hypothetical protein